MILWQFGLAFLFFLQWKPLLWLCVRQFSWWKNFFLVTTTTTRGKRRKVQPATTALEEKGPLSPRQCIEYFWPRSASSMVFRRSHLFEPLLVFWYTIGRCIPFLLTTYIFATFLDRLNMMTNNPTRRSGEWSNHKSNLASHLKSSPATPVRSHGPEKGKIFQNFCGMLRKDSHHTWMLVIYEVIDTDKSSCWGGRAAI